MKTLARIKSQNWKNVVTFCEAHHVAITDQKPGVVTVGTRGTLWTTSQALDLHQVLQDTFGADCAAIAHYPTATARHFSRLTLKLPKFR